MGETFYLCLLKIFAHFFNLFFVVAIDEIFARLADPSQEHKKGLRPPPS
jgi:hypothetical protein